MDNNCLPRHAAAGALAVADGGRAAAAATAMMAQLQRPTEGRCRLATDRILLYT